MKLDVISTQKTLISDRFSMRPVRKSDAGLLEMHASDARVAKMTRSIPHPLPPGATESFLARAAAADRTEDVWIIDGSASGLGEVLGVVGLERVDDGKSEIGYWVVPALWNSGIASEAVRTILDGNPLDSGTIFAEVFQDNPVSARVLTNAGFEYVGDAESYSVARGGPVATWTYLRRMDRENAR